MWQELAAGKEKEWKIQGREERNGTTNARESTEVTSLLLERVCRQTGQCDSPGDNHRGKAKNPGPPPFLLAAPIPKDIQPHGQDQTPG